MTNCTALEHSQFAGTRQPSYHCNSFSFWGLWSLWKVSKKGNIFHVLFAKLCHFTLGGTLVRRARAGHAPGIFCDLCPTGGLLLLICWATLYGFAPWPPGHQQMF